MSHTAKPTRARLAVPAAFLKKDPREAALMIARRLTTFVLPAGAIALAVAADLPPLWIALITLLAAPLAAVGLHALALVGHEGTHFNLHGNRLRSAQIGVVVSSMVPLHFDVGFAIGHAQHHRHTNDEAKDPDVALFRRYGRLASRLLLARAAASRRYAADTLRLAFGRSASTDTGAMGLSPAQLKGLARLNLAAAAFFLFVYAALAVLWPAPVLTALLPSYAAVLALSGVRPYLEHAGTDRHPQTNARTWTSPLADFAFSGINYHHAHHLLPGVPAYRIKAFHRWLVANGHITPERAVYVTRPSRAWRSIVGRQTYGSRSGNGGREWGQSPRVSV